jgi:hypothetical protein
MILEDFQKNRGFIDEMLNLTARMKQVGGLAYFLDLCSRRAKLPPSHLPMETAAMQAGFTYGYRTALEDIFDFRDDITAKIESTKPQLPDYGAARALLDDGTITPDEYTKLTGRAP